MLVILTETKKIVLMTFIVLEIFVFVIITSEIEVWFLV